MKNPATVSLSGERYIGGVRSSRMLVIKSKLRISPCHPQQRGWEAHMGSRNLDALSPYSLNVSLAKVTNLPLILGIFVEITGQHVYIHSPCRKSKGKAQKESGKTPKCNMTYGQSYSPTYGAAR